VKRGNSVVLFEAWPFSGLFLMHKQRPRTPVTYIWLGLECNPTSLVKTKIMEHP